MGYFRSAAITGLVDVICPSTQRETPSTSYNMAARALADSSHEGAKRPSAINQLSARAAML